MAQSWRTSLRTQVTESELPKMNVETNRFLETTDALSVGLDPKKWSKVLESAEQLTQNDKIPALAIQVQRRGLTTGSHVFGRKTISGTEPIDNQSRFLIASLTKPMVAMAVLLLAERGQLALNQRVSDIVPEFKGANKRQITIKHILTHTSGLPDMLPNNRELRAANSPLSKFVSETSATEMVFPCGQNAQYQSMGFALLGPVIENISGMPYASFIQQELFDVLGMTRTALGLRGDDLNDENIAEPRVPHDQIHEESWNWNSHYWRTFGAPWGGVLATSQDVSQFCRCMLTLGLTQSGEQLFNPGTVENATTNRLNDFPDIPEPVRRTRGWGYGWRMNWPDHRGSFGDFLGPKVYGHWGATGTLFWLDPETETALVLLSSQPYDRSVSPLVPLSNMISAAFV